MAIIYFYTLASVIIVSLISFVGAFAFLANQENLKKITFLLVGLSAGTLLGDSFFHLLPEIKTSNNYFDGWVWVLGGMLVFFILEKIIYWRHCHIQASDDHHHPFGVMNLVGDGLHNFIDGALIAGSFMVNINLGVATTIAVIAHEIPQEISDFGVFIHAGFSRGKALFLNFASGLTAVAGAAIAIFFGAQTASFVSFIIPFTAGGFIYVATADLIPELHKDTAPSRSLLQLLSIMLGAGIMLVLRMMD
ncbi:ZIP family metal transporter [Candidatus Falkowbacteria bacterium]|nr:ZIP family metal transporter [Candidatus Falkowbacteria bacterium]